MWAVNDGHSLDLTLTLLYYSTPTIRASLHPKLYGERTMTWTQVYDPFGHWWLSTLVAALPIIVLFGLLA
ncbi:MAG: hypothetical protein DMF66_14980, partial [Acidobacteria bacterium]